MVKVMDEKYEEICAAYNIDFTGSKRIRGAILLESRSGYFALSQYKDGPQKLYSQETIKKHLIEKGYDKVDVVMENKNGGLVTKDTKGTFWILRRWYVGRECSLKESTDIKRAIKHLAYLHNLMREIDFSEEKDIEDEENEKIIVRQIKNIPDKLERHRKELKRIQNYIRAKKQKNELELCILNQFKENYEQALMAQQCMADIDMKGLVEKNFREGVCIHGSYSYHNVIFGERDIATINFENAGIGIQILDLYDFMRKAMEKNDWSPSVGAIMLKTYASERKIEKDEAKLLYTMFLFPEKFWKQLNFYYNARKSWISPQNFEKLKKIEKQEADRKKFLEGIKKNLLM